MASSPSAPPSSPPPAKKPKYLIDLEDQISEEKRNIHYWKALAWSREKVIREWKEDMALAEKSLKTSQDRLAKLEAKLEAKA